MVTCRPFNFPLLLCYHIGACNRTVEEMKKKVASAHSRESRKIENFQEIFRMWYRPLSILHVKEAGELLHVEVSEGAPNHLEGGEAERKNFGPFGLKVMT